MHLTLHACLLCVACSVVISSGSFVTHSSELGHVTVMSASGEGLQSAAGEDLESDNSASGQTDSNLEVKPRNARRKHGGRKKARNQVTMSQTSRTHNPCLSSHRDYCIHGYCTYLQDLEEPVCVCMKGYDGVRCGIHVLQTGSGSGSGSGVLDKPNSSDSLHVTLIITAVILSLISCSAILLMICVHYRTQQSFQTALFSPSHESREPLKGPVV